jgi:hypothetical protein
MNGRAGPWPSDGVGRRWSGCWVREGCLVPAWGARAHAAMRVSPSCRRRSSLPPHRRRGCSAPSASVYAVVCAHTVTCRVLVLFLIDFLGTSAKCSGTGTGV